MISNSFVLRVMTAALCYEKQLSFPMSRRSVFEGPESTGGSNYSRQTVGHFLIK